MIPHNTSAIAAAIAAATKTPLILLLAMLLSAPAGAQTRELTAVPTDVVEMEIATVTLDPLSGAPLVLLRNPRGGELVPIFIGAAEARAILFSLHGAVLPRPMTHDLLHDVVTATGARLERVYIDAVTDNTYLGMLELTRPGQDAPVLVDARPSDALALALRADASIHIATQVLDSAREHQYGPLDSEQVATALGITVVGIDDDIRESLALPDTPGVIINQARGAAADAGLTAGMMIVRINAEPVDSPLRFLELIGATPEDEPVAITVWFEGQEREFELQQLPATPQPDGPAIRA
ncbi:MAG: bifunctional nuclease domain-containing protein [Pseudomonadales bacterium]